MQNDVEMANDAGSDPADDIKKQNGPGSVDKDDPKKTEKLAKAGETAVDPNAANPT